MQRFKEESFVGNTQKKRIQINHNGDFEHGKVLYMEPDWSYLDLLNAASQRLNLVPAAKRIFNVDGNEIDDCMMIEDHDILFFSMYEDFIPLTTINHMLSTSEDHKNKLKLGENIPPMIGGYKVGELLGRGGFGEVRIGDHQFISEKVALKFLKKSEIHSLGAAERTNIEIQCLTTLKHTNIIKMQHHLESTYHIVLVFELMEGGDLLKFLLQRKGTNLIDSKDNTNHHNKDNSTTNHHFSNHYNRDNHNSNSHNITNNTLKKHRLNEEEAKHVFYQIVSAISYAHNQHICHRDLKLENILLKDNSLSLVKIADFGLSDFYRPGSTMKSNCGTLSFLAPEVFQGTSNAGPPLDVWSLGVILFAILNGRLPFEGPDLKESKRPRDAIIKSRILKCQYKIDEGLSIESKDLIRRMLQNDPTERASVPEIFNHVWMRSYGNQSSYLSDYFYLNNSNNVWDSPSSTTKKYLVTTTNNNTNNIHNNTTAATTTNSNNKNESIHHDINASINNNNNLKLELKENTIRNNDWHIKATEVDNDITIISSDISSLIHPSKLHRSRNESSTSTLPISRHLSPANSSKSLYIDIEIDSADESSTTMASKGIIPTTTNDTRKRENSITSLLMNVNDHIPSHLSTTNTNTNNNTVHSEHSPTETTSSNGTSSIPMFFSNNVRSDSNKTITDGLDIDISAVDEKIIATNTFRLVPLRRGFSNNPDSFTNLDNINTTSINNSQNNLLSRPNTSSITSGNIRLTDIDEDAALVSNWRNININVPSNNNSTNTTANNTINNNINPSTSNTIPIGIGIGSLHNKTSHGRRNPTTLLQTNSTQSRSTSFHRRESLVNTRINGHHNQGNTNSSYNNSTNTSRNTSALNSPRNEYENTLISSPGISTYRNQLNNAGVNILNNNNNNNVLYNQPKHH